MTYAASIFGFLLWRTLVGAARRRLARLREPRYLLGGLVGAAYMYFWFGRAMLRSATHHQGLGPRLQLPPEAVALFLSLAAATLAVNAALFWLFHSGTPVLHLSEADVQFLAPAPLPRRALLHLSLLRTQLPLLFGALVMAIALGRNFVPHLWQAFVAAFLILATMQLHALGHAFWKARQREAAPATRSLMRLATGAVVLVGATALAWMAAAPYGAVEITSVADAPSAFRALVDGLQPWANGFVPRVVLAPFRAFLAPALASDTRHFLTALPAALAILAAHYAWVVRTNVRYEEAALEGARRRAARAERRRSGRLHGLAPEAKRAFVPFALPAEGRPEVAVLWKNLMSHRRARLSRAAMWWAALVGGTLVTSAALGVAYPTTAIPVLFLIAFVFAFVPSALALVLPMANRNDFREDLEKAAVLRTWPLSPLRLAVAELAAPLATSVGLAWVLVSLGIAAVVGARLALAWNGGSAGAASAATVPVAWVLPALFAMALLQPALSSAVLVVQNAAVLSFPAWFPPGGQRRGVEAMGTRLIAFFGTMILLLLALIPAALAAALTGFLVWSVLGPWSLVPAAAAASIPVWLEVAAGVVLLGRLFARFDVSSESWS
jgi:Putative ABC exporter